MVHLRGIEPTIYRVKGGCTKPLYYRCVFWYPYTVSNRVLRIKSPLLHLKALRAMVAKSGLEPPRTLDSFCSLRQERLYQFVYTAKTGGTHNCHLRIRLVCRQTLPLKIGGRLGIITASGPLTTTGLSLNDLIMELEPACGCTQGSSGIEKGRILNDLYSVSPPILYEWGTSGVIRSSQGYCLGLD